jgi:hypothetical protein
MRKFDSTGGASFRRNTPPIPKRCTVSVSSSPSSRLPAALGLIRSSCRKISATLLWPLRSCSSRAAGGAERETLARRKSTATLDRHGTLRGGEEIPLHQRLSRTLVAEGAPESAAHPAEGGVHPRSRWKLFAGRFTVPNIESRCNQTKLGSTSFNMVGWQSRSFAGPPKCGLRPNRKGQLAAASHTPRRATRSGGPG